MKKYWLACGYWIALLLSPVAGANALPAIIGYLTDPEERGDELYHSTLDDRDAVDSPRLGTPGASGLGAENFVAGQTKTAADFASASDYVSIPASNINLDAGEITFWYRPRYATTGDDTPHYLFSAGNVYAEANFFLRESDTLVFGLTDQDWNEISTGSSWHQDLWQAGDWVKIRVAWDNTDPTDSLRLYINDQRVGQPVAGGWSISGHPNIQSLTIGAGGTGGTRYTASADGVIDEFRIFGTRVPVTAVCGNNILESGEACDDGNTVSGDGCSNRCRVESTTPTCGNGSLEAGEQCDDGNTVSGDGCSSQCRSESTTPLNNTTNYLPTDDPAFVAGPAAPSSLQPFTPGNCTDLASLDVQNDLAFRRNNELAFSGIPVAKQANITSTDEFVLVGPGQQVLQAQFEALARWGSGPQDLAAPIRWLEVSTQVSVRANDTTYLALKHCPGTRSFNDPEAIRLSQTQQAIRIDTGAAVFVLDPDSPELFESITLAGGRQVYQGNGQGDGPGGPRLADGQGNSLTPYLASSDKVVIEQSGPVKAVIKAQGHFRRDNNNPACGADPGYTARFTFVRGQADMFIDFEVNNECGTGFSRPFLSYFPINKASWNFPFAVASNRLSQFATGDGTSVHRSSTGTSGSMSLEQRKGRVNNALSAWRRARITQDGQTRQQREFFPTPQLGLADGNFTASLQLAKMRYREPQALRATGNTLSLELVSEPKTLPEAQSFWGMAKLNLAAGSLSDAQVIRSARTGIAEIERGLLLHAQPAYLNASDVMPDVPLHNRVPNIAAYLALLRNAHQETTAADEYWDRSKVYGINLWPDYPYDGAVRNFSRPSQNEPYSNYWSASSAELKQWFVDGHPSWVWDFAYWQENHLLRTVAYNLGSRIGSGNDVRSGFGVGDGRLDVTQTFDNGLYRGNQGSDDYFYNQGSDEAYIIRPSGALRDAFWRAGTMFINRYNVPRSQQGTRDFYLSALKLYRGVMQHLNGLTYAAQFASEDNAAFQAKLKSVQREIIADNFFGGLPCQADDGNFQSCDLPQAFMLSALHLETFRNYYYHWGDLNGSLKRLFAGYAEQFFRQIPKRNGRPNLNAEWQKDLRCTFSNKQLQGCEYRASAEPVYDHEKPMHLSMLLIANDLDPAIDLCTPVSAVLDDALALPGFTYNFDEYAWFKGAAQSMRDVLHGIAYATTCAQGAGGN